MASKEPATESGAVELFTRAEVAKHNKSNDTWIIIHNNVYNVTEFLSKHPGGEEVLIEQAGGDGTEAFEDIGHSTDARQMMGPYQIGELAKEERTKSEAKENKDWTNEISGEDSSSGSWRSWLIPVALGVLATLVYRYFINAH